MIRTKTLLSLTLFVSIILLSLVFIYKLNIFPKKLSGNVIDNYNFGNKFCLDNECFYIVRDNGDTITAISEYNLLVGDTYDVQSGLSTEISEDTEGYGLQSELAKGYVEGADKYVGVLPFINENEEPYWLDSNGDIKSEYERTNPIAGTLSGAYVNDSNSLVDKHLVRYENYLKSNGYDVEVRMLNINDVFNLRCGGTYTPERLRKAVEEENYNYCAIKNNAKFPNWVYETSFWSGFAVDERMYVSMSYGDWENTTHDSTRLGVRTIIEIPKDEITLEEYYWGKEICIDQECFNILSQDETSLRLLPKYNLLVGYNVEYDENDNIVSKTKIPTSEKGYGLQSADAKGRLTGSNTAGAVMKFVNNKYSVYWLIDNSSNNDEYIDKYKRTFLLPDNKYAYPYDENCNFYDPINNYENYLKSVSNMKSIKAEMLDYEDFYRLVTQNMTVEDAYFPSWYNKANFATGVFFGRDAVMEITDDEYTLLKAKESFDYHAVRPIITVSKEELKNSSKVITKNNAVTTKAESSHEVVNKTIIKYIRKNKTTTVATTTNKTTNLLKDSINTKIIKNYSEYNICVKIIFIIDCILLIWLIIEIITYLRLKTKTGK